MKGIMYSLHKKWIDKIFSGEKAIEFRTKLPKQLKRGTKLYFYETKKNNGLGQVVGECIVADIISTLDENGKWFYCGCCPFLEYYFNNVVGDFELANHIKNIKNEFSHKFSDFKPGYIYHYMMSEENLNEIRKTGHSIDTWRNLDVNLIKKICTDLETADALIEMCDDWLFSIGYYNEFCESTYKWGIVLGEVKKYEKPIPITDFSKSDGSKYKIAPQSFYYIY